MKIKLTAKPYTWAEFFRLVREHLPIDMRRVAKMTKSAGGR